MTSLSLGGPIYVHLKNVYVPADQHVDDRENARRDRVGDLVDLYLRDEITLLSLELQEAHMPRDIRRAVG